VGWHVPARAVRPREAPPRSRTHALVPACTHGTAVQHAYPVRAFCVRGIARKETATTAMLMAAAAAGCSPEAGMIPPEGLIPVSRSRVLRIIVSLIPHSVYKSPSCIPRWSIASHRPPQLHGVTSASTLAFPGTVQQCCRAGLMRVKAPKGPRIALSWQASGMQRIYHPCTKPCNGIDHVVMYGSENRE